MRVSRGKSNIAIKHFVDLIKLPTVFTSKTFEGELTHIVIGGPELAHHDVLRPDLLRDDIVDHLYAEGVLAWMAHWE